MIDLSSVNTQNFQQFNCSRNLLIVHHVLLNLTSLSKMINKTEKKGLYVFVFDCGGFR